MTMEEYAIRKKFLERYETLMSMEMMSLMLATISLLVLLTLIVFAYLMASLLVPLALLCVAGAVGGIASLIHGWRKDRRLRADFLGKK